MTDKAKTVADFVQALKDNDVNEATKIIDSIMSERIEEQAQVIRQRVMEEAGFVVAEEKEEGGDDDDDDMDKVDDKETDEDDE